MASFLVKALAVSAGVGAVGAGGGITYFMLRETEKPIADLLKENNKALLQEQETTESPEWKTNWQKFKDKYTKTNHPTGRWQIDGVWATIFDASNVDTNFKKKCTENSKIKVKSKDDALYKEVESYCSKNA